MKSLSFRKDLVGVQDELLRFAYKLTTDREEANDLKPETCIANGTLYSLGSVLTTRCISFRS